MAAAADYVVVVNETNEFSGDPAAIKQQLKKLFLKQQSEWPSGEKAIPFDRDGDSASHQALLTVILGMTEAEIAAHWKKMKQVRGDTPPRAVGSASILLRLLAKKKGAFGIVKSEEAANLPKGVKEILSISAN